MKLALLPLILIFLQLPVFAQQKCAGYFTAPKVERYEEWDDVKVLVTEATLFGKKVELRRVERNQLIKGRTVFAENLGGDDAFFIGLNSAGHMYLVANVYRYDGKFAFEKPQLNTRSSLLDKGLVLRIEDRDGRIQDEIIDYLKNKGAPRSIDCAAGVCKMMSEASGIQLAENLRQTILPNELLKKLITKGVRGADGHPKKVQVFIIGNSDPQTIIQASERASRQYVKALAPYAVGVTVAATGIIASFINFFL